MLLFGIAPSIAPGNDASGIQPPGPEAPGLTRSITRYETRIAELEAAAGPHAAELVEVRQGLGMLYQQAGDHGRRLSYCGTPCNRYASTKDSTA